MPLVAYRTYVCIAILLLFFALGGGLLRVALLEIDELCTVDETPNVANVLLPVFDLSPP